MGSVLLLAAADLEVIGLSPCRGVLCVLLAWSAYGRGPSGGAALGLGVGLTADLCGGTAGVYTAAFGLAGLLCGSCYRRWRWCAALAFLGGIAAASLPGRNVGLVVETAAGMSVFLLLPGRVFGGKRVRRPSQEERDREAGQQWKIQLSRAAGARGMVWGQELDLAFEQKQAEAEELREIHRSKTGELICAAAQLGAIAAGADESQRTAVRAYAYPLGMVFQIVDDILDVTATRQRLGKPIGSDQANGKTTFITLYGVDGARQIAQKLTDEAVAALSGPFGEHSRFLQTLAVRLLDREQ